LKGLLDPLLAQRDLARPYIVARRVAAKGMVAQDDVRIGVRGDLKERRIEHGPVFGALFLQPFADDKKGAGKVEFLMHLANRFTGGQAIAGLFGVVSGDVACLHEVVSIHFAATNQWCQKIHSDGAAYISAS
jgi:hypothetical protein